MHLVATRGGGFGILAAMKKKATNKITAARSLPARGNGPKTKRRDLAERIITLVEEAKRKVVSAVNVALVYTYYEVGRMIVEEEQCGKKRAEYGKAQLQGLSKKLTVQLGKGWGAENLRLMRKLYLVFSKEIQNAVLEIPSDSVNPVCPIGEAKTASQSKIVSGVYEIKKATYPFRLSWSHYLVLMRIDNPDERRFYEIEAAENGWDLDELKRQFNSSLYERLALSRDKKGVLELSKRGQIVRKPEDAVKDPYVLEFLGLEEKAQYSETELESRIIEHVEQFMLEMGKGFILVGRQVRFTFEEKHFRVDLVFYNRILRGFVVVDLKTGELTHQDIGQMQMYVNYYDRMVKMAEENPTIGILLCADKNDAIVEMTLPKGQHRIFASKYLTILPDKETLRALVRKQLACGE